MGVNVSTTVSPVGAELYSAFPEGSGLYSSFLVGTELYSASSVGTGIGGLSCINKPIKAMKAANMMNFEMTIPIILNAMPLFFFTAHMIIPISEKV